MSTINRELIRLSNREQLNATEVSDLIQFSAGLLAFRERDAADSDTLVATALFETWKASYDAEPPSQG